FAGQGGARGGAGRVEAADRTEGRGDPEDRLAGIVADVKGAAGAGVDRGRVSGVRQLDARGRDGPRYDPAKEDQGRLAGKAEPVQPKGKGRLAAGLQVAEKEGRVEGDGPAPRPFRDLEEFEPQSSGVVAGRVADGRERRERFRVPLRLLDREGQGRGA